MSNIIIEKTTGSYRYTIIEENGVYCEESTHADGNKVTTMLGKPTTVTREVDGEEVEVSVIHNRRGEPVDMPNAA